MSIHICWMNKWASECVKYFLCIDYFKSFCSEKWKDLLKMIDLFNSHMKKIEFILFNHKVHTPSSIPY